MLINKDCKTSIIHPIPDQADVALEEAVHSNIHVHLDEEDADEFAEFVFAAAFDVGNETNVNAELLEE